MKSDLAINLKKVLDNMSQEQFDQIWSEITALNLEGPSFDDVIEYFSFSNNLSYNFESDISSTAFIVGDITYVLAA